MKLFNTLTRKKEEFIPNEAGKVKMYACGPTVYNYFHIGNARPLIIFDALRRYMEYRGYEVTFVQNFTDIDDKMIKRANEEGITVKELAERFIKEYFVDAKGLGVREATFHPKATENIDSIIDIIKELENKGFAYAVNGDVYFSSKRFNEYGKLSHHNLEDLESGARVDVDERKKDPVDFALWKAQKPGEPAWESPWGMGRPGWHIECSAMVQKILGDSIDIHCGGEDLIFPHHENEIAQSEAATGKPFAKYWLHNGFINVDNQKMSKSLNNFFTVRDIVEKFDYEVIRFFMLSAQYRSPVNFSAELLEQAQNGLERIRTCRDNMEHLLKFAKDTDMTESDVEISSRIDGYKAKFIEAMDNDFNSADGITAIFELVKELNSSLFATSSEQKSLIEKGLGLLNELCDVLGVAQKKQEKSVDDEIQKLVDERQQARKDRNFKRADEIRDILKDMGIVLEDTPQGIKIVYK